MGHCSEQMETSGLTKVTLCACYYHDNSPQPAASVLRKGKAPSSSRSASVCPQHQAHLYNLYVKKPLCQKKNDPPNATGGFVT